MPFVDVGGTKLHTQELGGGPRTVVLVHGLFANMALWYFSLAPVLARRHRVVLYDLRGHGRSDRTEGGYALSPMSEDLSAVVDAATDGTVSLVGFSFGAAIALRYAVDHPDRVDALVAVEPPLPMDLGAPEAWFLGLSSPTDALDILPAPQRRAASARPRSSRLVQGMRGLLKDSDLRSDIGSEPDIPDAALAGLRARVLFCYGEDSPITASGTRARLDTLLPRAERVIIPGSHFLPTENPGRLSAVIADFLTPDVTATSADFRL